MQDNTLPTLGDNSITQTPPNPLPENVLTDVLNIQPTSIENPTVTKSEAQQPSISENLSNTAIPVEQPIVEIAADQTVPGLMPEPIAAQASPVVVPEISPISPVVETVPVSTEPAAEVVSNVNNIESIIEPVVETQPAPEAISVQPEVPQPDVQTVQTNPSEESELNVADAPKTNVDEPQISSGIVSDIAPEVKPQANDVLAQPVEDLVLNSTADVNTPVVAETAPVTTSAPEIAPVSEASQNIFNSVASEVNIPAATNTSVEQNLLIQQTQTVATNKLSESNKKSVNFGSIIRYIIWLIILLLGVVSLILGIYFAQLINLPFLDAIFKK